MPEREYQDVPIDEMDGHIREIVREEIASLAGKALRRTQDREYTRVGERNMMVDIANEQMAQFWAEVLAEYGHADTIEDGEGNTVGFTVPDEQSSK